MNVIELLVFVLFCLALGFLGHLSSPRYGWWVGVLVAASVVILLLAGSYRRLFREIRQGVRARQRNVSPHASRRDD